MAFSISSSVPIITPAYTPIEFTMSDPACDYMELEIYVGDSSKGQYAGTKRTLRLVATSITVDIQGIIQPFFQSDASGTVDIKRFDIKGRSVIGDASTETYLDNYYVFNGVPHEPWVANDYKGKFLNNWDAPINIHWGDKKLNLYLFSGIFTNSTGTYDVSNCFFRTTTNGTPSAGFTISGTTPIIYELKADPSSMSGLTFNANTTQYTIDPSLNSTNDGRMEINIIPKDGRYTPKRISWVDSMSCINSFNFDLDQKNQIQVSKTTFNNNGTLKQYNNRASDKYTIISNWISEKESMALKDLWYSPSIMVDDKYVIIDSKTTKILKRRDEGKLINYEIDYEVANEYRVQNN